MGRFGQEQIPQPLGTGFGLKLFHDGIAAVGVARLGKDGLAQEGLDPLVHVLHFGTEIGVRDVCVYTEGSITRTSDAIALGKTQPSAVSHAMEQLRTLIDQPLFVRLGHSMTPTPVALERKPATAGP